MIEALKLARNFIKFNTGSSHYVIEQLDQAIAEAEKQEPVATVHASWNDDEGFMLVKRTGERLNMGDSLYTHPQPKREPLTDEQILADETLRYHFGMNGGAGPVSRKGRAVIAAIEAAHGIKENT